MQVSCAAKPPAGSAEAAPVDRFADNPTARFAAHFARAITAAIFDDPAALRENTAVAMQSLVFVPGNYATAVARVLRGLSLAADARTGPAEERPGLFAELEDVMRWLAARAADAPENFGHLLSLLEAERSWAAGDFDAAALAFDAARGEVSGRQRPWHRALINERAARFAPWHRACNRPGLNFSPMPARSISPGVQRRRLPNWIGRTQHCGRIPTPPANPVPSRLRT